MKKALVLGAGGFIGSHMAKKLRNEGYWVRGVDLKHTEFGKTEATDFVIGDLRNPLVVEDIMNAPEGRELRKGSFDEVKYEDPMLLFSEWYQNAHENQCADPHAVVLGTVNRDSQPSSRIVYMRELLEEGIVIYTNYLSRKGYAEDDIEDTIELWKQKGKESVDIRPD